MKLSNLKTKEQIDKYISNLSYTGESLEEATNRIQKKRTKFGLKLARFKNKK